MASITSATSGLSTATSTWTGGVVPVVGDKVTIQHPGTNSQAAGTQYTSNTAGYAIGATSITLITGTGTILAGECVQFETSIGTDEDGRPIYDNTYYNVTTGVTAAGQSLVISPGLAVALPPAATRLVNRGHVVSLAGTHVWGDDTSANSQGTGNGVNIVGTLRASRTASSSLTLRGSGVCMSGGTVDLAAAGDLLGAGVTCEMRVNDSAAPVSGKHVLASLTSSLNVTWRLRGATRTRNTRLTAGTAAGAVSITVDASTGWAIGDRLVVASDTDDPARSQVVTISGGAAPTWALSAITNARAAACRIGNLSSNLVVRTHAPATPGCFGVIVATGSTVGKFGIEIADVRVEDLGNGISGWAASNIPPFEGAFGIQCVLGPTITVRRVAIETPANTSAAPGFATYLAAQSRHRFRDAAIHMTVSQSGFNHGGGANWDIYDCVVYRSLNANLLLFGGPSKNAVIGGESWATSYVANGTEQGRISFDSHIAHSAYLFNAQGSTYTFDACALSFTTAMYQINLTGGWGSAVLRNCTLAGAGLAGSLTGATANAPSATATAVLSNINATPSDNRVLSHQQTVVTDTGTRKRGTYAVKIKPNVAGVASVYSFVLPAVAGVQQTIKGSLYFDTNYGTATPPVIALSGQGVAQSHTCPAAANAWNDFSFSFTPTGTGDITATVTVQSAASTGFAWLDGIYHYPMTQAVRHFGYLWQAQAAQVVDTRITLTEAAALAQPVAVNHGTSTITVTGAVTARQVFEACLADLCATANNALAVHISSSTGAEFATTYTVALSGAGAITGVYADAAGVHVQITAPALVAGSAVQLYNVTNGVQIYNGVLAGAGLVVEAVYTANKIVRLRADKDSKLALQTIGVLTSSGLSFLDVQADDTVYAGNAIDGSTVNEFAPDGPNIHININDPDGLTSFQRLYAWLQYYQTTPAGIASDFFGAMYAIDSTRYVVNQALANILLSNVGAIPVRFLGSTLERADGSNVIAPGSFSIQIGMVIKVAASDGSAPPTAPAIATAVRTELTIELARLDAATSTRATQASIAALPAPDNVGIAAIKARTDALPAIPAAVGDIPSAASIASAVWSAVTRTLSASAVSVADIWAHTTRTLTASPDPTAAQVASAVRTELATELGRLDAATSSRATQASIAALPAPDNAGVAAIKAKTDNLPVDPAAASGIPSAAAIAAAVWGSVTRTLTAGALTAADVWGYVTRSLTGSATGPTAWEVATAVRTELATELGRLDAATSSRATQASITALPSPDNAGIAAIKARTDALPASPAAVGDIPSAAGIATAVQGTLDDDFAVVVAAVGTRLSAGAYTAPDNAGIAAIKARTDLLPADPASQAAVLAAIAAGGGGGGGGGGGADPLLSVVPGGYLAGTAGHALGKLNATPPDVPVIVIPGAPAALGLCRVYGFIETPDNRPAAGVKVEFRLVALAPGLTASERIISGRSVVMTTNSSGEVASADGPWIDLQRTDLLIPAGAIYEVTSAELGVQRKVITLTTATADLRDLLLAP